MNDIVREEREVKIYDTEFIMYFDMRSIATYEQLTGREFNQDLVGLLFKQTDKDILNFMACIVRRKDDKERKPLGKELLEGDILSFLIHCRVYTIEILFASIPMDEETPKKK